MSDSAHQTDITGYLGCWNKLDRYAKWQYHLYRPYVGHRCLDIGGGIGTAISYYIDSVDALIATELFQNDVDIMNERFAHIPYFKALKLDIMNDDFSELVKFAPDTIICIQCLEHIEDDVRAMRIMGEILSDNGKIVLCVPAIDWLYCHLDRNVGHFRRYKKGELKTKAQQAGLAIIDNFYMNFMGIIPYFLKAKLCKAHSLTDSFSSSITSFESRVYAYATVVLEQIESIQRPPLGISEFIVLSK